MFIRIFVLHVFMLVSVNLQAQLADSQHVSFYRADSVADANFGASVTDLSALSHTLTYSFTRDEEKFRAIYKWVCNNIEFDYDLFRINREKRDKYDSPKELAAWNKKLSAVVFRNLILDKKTVCTGYAWLIQQLAQHAGLPCVIVDGYGRNATVNIRKSGKANHSWNAVQLNNRWYLCDATWSSGAYDADRELFIKNYDDAYFLADPNVFIRNHFPLESQWTLLEAREVNQITTRLNSTQPTLTEFLNGPLIYTHAYKLSITQLYPTTFDIEANKNELLNFKFSSDQAIECITLSIHKNGEVEFHEPIFYKNSEGLYDFSHTFLKNGRYVVHISLNNSYAYTYTVTVK